MPMYHRLIMSESEAKKKFYLLDLLEADRKERFRAMSATKEKSSYRSEDKKIVSQGQKSTTK